MMVTPTTSSVMAAVTVSAWPGATKITSPLLAVHLPMAASMVARGLSQESPALTVSDVLDAVLST